MKPVCTEKPLHGEAKSDFKFIKSEVNEDILANDKSEANADIIANEKAEVNAHIQANEKVDSDRTITAESRMSPNKQRGVNSVGM